jgi:3-methylcrotonyl-CoA carboxylase alpha subunit
VTTLLVANRGEVAIRVFRTARYRLNMRCAAVYSEADEDAPFVRYADVAIPIGPAPAADSYLRIDRILEAAKELQADLIHPGYGFLAEDAEFAEACVRGGFIFVGPPPAVLRLMGSKDSARAVAIEAGVPVLPGYSGDEQTDDVLTVQGELIGYPVMVKPAEGGGGKGMGVAQNQDQLKQIMQSARRIGMAAFGSDRLLLEKFLDGARHIEVQILSDGHGNVVHLGERDCSVQRRHQKVIEEAPAPGISTELREQLWDSGVRLTAAAGYQNAGTCEFVVGRDGQFGFIEMNARLQVEHGVTEQITGFDLVELQLRIAQGEPLPFVQKDVAFDGHAIEARVYAEDPAAGFLPQAGEVLHLRWPSVDDARVDTGIVEGAEIPPHYDPLIAKVIVGNRDRPSAISNLEVVLSKTEILGVQTNLAFLEAAIRDETFRRGTVTTDWLDSAQLHLDVPARPPDEVLALAGAAEANRLVERARNARDPWSRLGPWRTAGSRGLEVIVRVGDEELTMSVEGRGPFKVGPMSLEPLDEDRSISSEDPGLSPAVCHAWIVNGERGAAARGDDVWFVWWQRRQFEIPVGPRERHAEETAAAHLEAPMPGQVIAVRVAAGDKVARGAELVVVEAMKMEHTVRAPADGVVTAVLCGPGDQVDRRQVLVDFEPA